MIMREKKNTTMRKKIGDMRKIIKFCKKVMVIMMRDINK